MHIVDEATHFTVAKFLKTQSTSDVWKAITSCWKKVYLGPPDILPVDQGINLVSKEFLSTTEAERIEVIEASIESPYTMLHVERYQAPL